MSAQNHGLNNKVNKAYFSDTQKFQLALEYSGIGVWEYDAELDRVFFSNESKRILGIEDPDFGTNPQDWNHRVHPDDKITYFQDFQDHLNGLKPMYENVHRIKVHSGSYKWILDKGKIVEWDADGKPKRVLGTHTDITDQKKNEIKSHKALLIATEHNNRLKNFAHIVTHNLKQHTSNFEGLMCLYENADSDEERAEFALHLKTLSNLLSKTISNLNEIVSVQSNKSHIIEKIYIAEEIDRILKILNLAIVQSNATIFNNVNKKLFVNYNASYFESIIQNLFSNALKYKHPDRDPIITIDAIYETNGLKLMISDNGVGIDLQKYGKDVFGLYKTFHRNDNAEGVGLYLIKNQIETFGGEITIKSEVNVGTTFTIYTKNKKSLTKG